MTIDGNRSRFFSISFKCSDIRTFWGYMSSIGTTFFLKLISKKKNPSIVISVNISFDGISSSIYESIPPPLQFLLKLYDSEKS